MRDQIVTTIVLFEVPADAAEKFVAGWLASNEFMKRQKGLLEGTLYAAGDDGARYRFVNVAKWASEEDLARARKNNSEHQKTEGANLSEEWQTLGIKMSACSYWPKFEYSSAAPTPGAI